MSNIIPSTSLKYISVARISAMSCFRFYFWKYIRNLAPKGINLNFYYGGMFGAGIEQMLLDGKYLKSKVSKALIKEYKERIISPLNAEDKAEIEIQDQLINVILRAAAEQPFFKDMRMKKNQVEVSYKVIDNISFYGIVDGLGTYKKYS